MATTKPSRAWLSQDRLRSCSRTRSAIVQRECEECVRRRRMNKQAYFTNSLLVRRCIWLVLLIAVGLVTALPAQPPPVGVLDFRLELGSLQPQAVTVPH